MAETVSHKLKLMAGALRIHQRHAQDMKFNDLHHILSVAELEIRDILARLEAEQDAPSSSTGNVIELQIPNKGK